MGAWLLIIELVARYSDDLKPKFLPLLISLSHFLIVCGGKSSLTGNIDNHCQSFSFEVFEVKVFASDIFHFELKEFLCRNGLF